MIDITEFMWMKRVANVIPPHPKKEHRENLVAPGETLQRFTIYGNRGVESKRYTR